MQILNILNMTKKVEIGDLTKNANLKHAVIPKTDMNIQSNSNTLRKNKP